MKALFALIEKECTEQFRTGKLMILGIIFVLFGIMNPAIAKLTPWLLEIMEDSLSQSGMTVTTVTITAMDSWVQFFKNIPMALIVFVLLEGNIFTREYASGTLILSLTKGLKRYKTVVSKGTVLLLLWTEGFWLCFAITYCYNAYFWDNSVAQNLLVSVLYWWVFGIFIISVMILFSTLSRSSTGVLLCSGGIVFAMYIIGFVSEIKKYLPVMLTDANSLIYGTAEPKTYVGALVVALVTGVACLVFGIFALNRKQL